MLMMTDYTVYEYAVCDAAAAIVGECRVSVSSLLLEKEERERECNRLSEDSPTLAVEVEATF